MRETAPSHASSKRKRGLVIAAVLTVAEVIGLWRRTGRPGGNIVVRCRAGHLYTTLWIPGISVKAARLGWWRFQRCPVGHHFSLVTPVDESQLSDAERHSAHEHHDIRLP
jgi:hypothetical protein